MLNSNNHRGVFITGTDTGVGKTFVSALLCRLLKKSQNICYFKPIQTGSDDDTLEVIERAQLTSAQVLKPVYKYALPASPDRAAAAVGEIVDENKIISAVNDKHDQFLIIEGAGGIEVPIRPHYKMGDLMRSINVPAVIVASTRLGTINHTLLSLKSLKYSGVEVLGVILCGEEDAGLAQVLEREGVCVLAHIPRVDADFKDWDNLAMRLQPIVSALSQKTKSIDWQERDAAVVWHPFTQHKIEKDFPVITRGQGSILFTEKGDEVLDATSSWWVNLHGHSHLEIVGAIAEQAARMEHAIFAGYTHTPAIELSERILKKAQELNPELKRTFFSDNGSTAVEVALKMAYQYQELRGEKRTKFLALNNSYHGDTLGAMSVSEREGYHKYFLPLMAPVEFIPTDDFDALEKMLPRMNEFVACIVEPLVQGAGGMRIYSEKYLQQLEKYCRAHGVVLIADEIFTGFSRTGTFLASSRADFKADIVCLSKGITGGFLPLSVSLVTEEIYNAFLADSKAQAFLHGHSYTANPIACAAALKSLEILERPETVNNIARISEETKNHLQSLKLQHPSILSVRSLGTIGALDVNAEENYFSTNVSLQVAQFCFKKGVLLRSLGSTIYTVPPYCTTPQQLSHIYSTISQAITEVIEKGAL